MKFDRWKYWSTSRLLVAVVALLLALLITTATLFFLGEMMQLGAIFAQIMKALYTKIPP